MLSTGSFAAFFAVVLTIYWLCRGYRNGQNFVLLVASLLFYGWSVYDGRGDLRIAAGFSSYLLFIALSGYSFGELIQRQHTTGKRKLILTAGICTVSAGFIYAKYSPLAQDVFSAFYDAVFIKRNFINVIAPLGISFYTLASIGYLADVFSRRIEAEENVITYCAYITFFPHILSGPIANAADILPQFRKKASLSMGQVQLSAMEISWGLFKKMVVADNLGPAVNYCFKSYGALSGSTLFIGLVMFSFQVYADFSGYSDMARGLARLLGVELCANFRLPFFSTNPREFWQRWHTSLRKWLINYVYVPLGGSRRSKLRYVIVLFFVFVLSGLWHGANKTFIYWGALNALFFIPYVLLSPPAENTPVTEAGFFPTFRQLPGLLLTFNLINLSRVFFRSPDVPSAIGYYSQIFSAGFFTMPDILIVEYFGYCLPLIAIELVLRNKQFLLKQYIPPRFYNSANVRFAISLVLCLTLVLTIFFLSRKHDSVEYYYFRF